MTQQKYQDDQFLRKAFDKVYTIDPDEIKGQIVKEVDHLKHIDRRILGMSMTVIALAVLIIVVLGLLQAGIDQIKWQNRPSFQERMTAPYDLEMRLPPTLDNAVWVEAEVETSKMYYPANFNTATAADSKLGNLLAQVIQIQSILPAQIGEYTLQPSRVQSTLLNQCMLSTGFQSVTNCPNVPHAEFLEAGNFLNKEGEALSFVMSKFGDSAQAASVYKEMYQYARSIGHIGNFANLDMLVVDYFFSTTRDVVSFTWTNENWIFTISSADFENINAFMEAFPLFAA